MFYMARIAALCYFWDAYMTKKVTVLLNTKTWMFIAHNSAWDTSYIAVKHFVSVYLQVYRQLSYICTSENI